MWVCVRACGSYGGTETPKMSTISDRHEESWTHPLSRTAFFEGTSLLCTSTKFLIYMALPNLEIWSQII